MQSVLFPLEPFNADVWEKHNCLISVGLVNVLLYLPNKIIKRYVWVMDQAWGQDIGQVCYNKVAATLPTPIWFKMPAHLASHIKEFLIVHHKCFVRFSKNQKQR